MVKQSGSLKFKLISAVVAVLVVGQCIAGVFLYIQTRNEKLAELNSLKAQVLERLSVSLLMRCGISTRIRHSRFSRAR